MFFKHLSQSRREVTAGPNVTQFPKMLTFYFSFYCWNHHGITIQTNTNMPGIGLVIGYMQK